MSNSITQLDVEEIFGVKKKKMGRIQRAILEKYDYNPDTMTYGEIFRTFEFLRKEHKK